MWAPVRATRSHDPSMATPGLRNLWQHHTKVARALQQTYLSRTNLSNRCYEPKWGLVTALASLRWNRSERICGFGQHEQIATRNISTASASLAINDQWPSTSATLGQASTATRFASRRWWKLLRGRLENDNISVGNFGIKNKFINSKICLSKMLKVQWWHFP